MQPEFDRPALQSLFMDLTARVPQLVWTAGDDGRWTWASPRWTAYTGLSDEASKGYGWQTAIHPGDRAAMVAGWREASVRGEIDVDHRLLRADHGDARWFNTKSRPIADDQGDSKIWLGTCTDINDERMLRQRQQPLRRQMEHRVVNVVALTRLVSRRTARASDSIEDYKLHLDSRLDAIARMQTMMLRDPRGGVDLASVVAEKLLAHAVHESEQVRIAGPVVRVHGVAADLLCLALHELAMNAVEHGAFAAPVGQLAVTWMVETSATGGTLRLEWRESGTGTAWAQRRPAGFGTELIERILCQQLGGDASLSFEPDGVRCAIVLPLSKDLFAVNAQAVGLRRVG